MFQYKLLQVLEFNLYNACYVSYRVITKQESIEPLKVMNLIATSF